MSRLSRPAVVRLAVPERRARRQLEDLVAEAADALAAAQAGELAAVFATHRALGRAVRLLLEFRLDAA